MLEYIEAHAIISTFWLLLEGVNAAVSHVTQLPDVNPVEPSTHAPCPFTNSVATSKPVPPEATAKRSPAVKLSVSKSSATTRLLFDPSWLWPELVSNL